MAAVISRMQVLPLTCAIGAEVRGVDLGEASRSPDAMERSPRFRPDTTTASWPPPRMPWPAAVQRRLRPSSPV